MCGIFDFCVLTLACATSVDLEEGWEIYGKSDVPLVLSRQSGVTTKLKFGRDSLLDNHTVRENLTGAIQSRIRPVTDE